MTPKIRLGGPTNFAPSIRKSIEVVKMNKGVSRKKFKTLFFEVINNVLFNCKSFLQKISISVFDEEIKRSCISFHNLRSPLSL